MKQHTLFFALMALLALWAAPSHATVTGEQWEQIVSECQEQAQGQPALFTQCAFGRLTYKELSQCLNGGCKDLNGNTLVLPNLGAGLAKLQCEKDKKGLGNHLAVINTTGYPIKFSVTAKHTQTSDFSLEPWKLITISVNNCDEWVNVYGAGKALSHLTGSVMTFAHDRQGNVQQYSLASQ